MDDRKLGRLVSQWALHLDQLDRITPTLETLDCVMGTVSGELIDFSEVLFPEHDFGDLVLRAIAPEYLKLDDEGINEMWEVVVDRFKDRYQIG